MKTTYEQIYQFAFAARTWLSRDEKNAERKMGYAIKRLSPRIEKIQQRYQNAREDIQIDCCSTDDKGIILRDDRGEYRFSKSELKRRNKEWQELFESAVEIKPYIATEIPDDLTDEEREAFAGFVIEGAAVAAEA